MVTAARHRVLLLALALLSYVVVTAVFVVFERPGLGLGHFYYVPIALAAFATGPAIGDIDELQRINRQSRERGDDALRRLGGRLVASKRPDDDVARVGGDEFAVLGRLGPVDARTLPVRIENQLRLAGESVTFGWATFPQDGDNALALYRAANERLYARKMAGGFRRAPSDAQAFA